MSQPHVLVVGGGLAGLAATVRLASQGCPVTLLESRPRLGGRASSFTDASSQQLIDACQHVSMGCCQAFADFCKELGIEKYLAAQESLYFMTPDGRVSRWCPDPWPAPLHLSRAFLRAHFLSWKEKLSIGLTLLRLWWWPPPDDVPLLAWLRQQRQTQRCLDRFWSVVLVSALNESLDRVGIRYARQVFVEGMLRSRRGGTVFVPTVPLGRLYGHELLDWLARHAVTVRLGEGVRRVVMEGQRIRGVELRSGQQLAGAAVVLAVSPERVGDLVPASSLSRAAEALEFSPITSIHLWYDRPITELPHIVLVDCLGQWLFNRGPDLRGQHYYQVVVSAARQFHGWKQELIGERVAAELRSLFPAAQSATLQRLRVVTEHHATFSVLPGVDRHRPAQRGEIPGLYVAGDWTATGWPATMEGAVRSGNLAAAAVLADFARN